MKIVLVYLNCVVFLLSHDLRHNNVTLFVRDPSPLPAVKVMIRQQTLSTPPGTLPIWLSQRPPRCLMWISCQVSSSCCVNSCFRPFPLSGLLYGYYISFVFLGLIKPICLGVVLLFRIHILPQSEFTHPSGTVVAVYSLLPNFYSTGY